MRQGGTAVRRTVTVERFRVLAQYEDELSPVPDAACRVGRRHCSHGGVVRARAHRYIGRVGAEGRSRGRPAPARGADRLRRLPDQLAVERPQPDRRRSLPGIRSPRGRLDLVPLCDHLRRRDRACVSRDLHQPNLLALREAQLREASEQPLHAARPPVPRGGRRGGNELLPEAALPERAPADQRVDRARASGGPAGAVHGLARALPPIATPDVLLQARAVPASALGLSAVGTHLLRRAERERGDQGGLGLNPVAERAEVSAAPAAGRARRSSARACARQAARHRSL